MAIKPSKEATPTEKFWFKTITSWKNKAKSERQDLEKMSQAYRTMYYPREEGANGALAFDDGL